MGSRTEDREVLGSGAEDDTHFIALYLIADHFRALLCRDAALKHLYATHNERSHDPVEIKESISDANKLCFGSASAASKLVIIFPTSPPCRTSAD